MIYKGKMGKTKHTIEEFHKIAESKGGKCLSNFKLTRTDNILKFQCSKGHSWECEARNVQCGKWCKKCADENNRKYTLEYFKQLAIKNNGECLSDSYNKLTDRLKFKCYRGHIWETRSSHIIEGTWCSQCNNRKYDVDNNFFSKDTEESFYVAGFLAADGNVFTANGGNRITLRLAKKDIEHLKKIHGLLKCTAPITLKEKFIKTIIDHDINKILYSGGFTFNSKQCCKDLEKFSVFPNKTYYLRFPEWLCKHHFVNHYIRGYIDGDGSFIKSGKRLLFSMKGTKEFLEVVHQIFLDNGVCDPNIKRKSLEAKDGKKFAAFDELCYCGINIISRMYDFLYKDATIYLERKEKIAKQSKIYIKKYNDKLIINKLKITKEYFLEKVYEFDNLTKTAEYFGFTQPNIYSIAKQLNAKTEIDSYINSKKIDFKYVYEKYLDLKSYNKTAKTLGISQYSVNKAIKLYKGKHDN